MVNTRGLRHKFRNIKVLESEAKIPHRHVVLSAYQTSDARARLTRHMWDVLDKGGNVYYGDTDSCDASVKLPTGEELGELKSEFIITKADYRQPKLYRLEGWKVRDGWKKGDPIVVRKHKGFRDVGEDIFDNELLFGGDIEQRRMLGQSEMLDYFARNDVKNMSMAPREIRFKKHANVAKIPKRKPLKDGHTRPWTIEELTDQGQSGIRKPLGDLPPINRIVRAYDPAEPQESYPGEFEDEEKPKTKSVHLKCPKCRKNFDAAKDATSCWCPWCGRIHKTSEVRAAKIAPSEPETPTVQNLECPKCKTQFSVTDINNIQCPKCGFKGSIID